MIRTDKRIRLAKLLCLCCLAFIWVNSLLPGEISGAISDWVKGLIDAVLPGEDTPSTGRGLLRKIAHFTEFTALGMSLGWLFGMLQKGKLLPFLLGAGAACMDETIQRFVPDRGPSVKDVLLDCTGVLTGIILLYLGHTYFKRKQQIKNMEDTP